MYYQSYEDYMRDILGYPRENAIHTYNYNMHQNRRRENTEIESLYPDIYRTVYPMVCKACNQYNGEITEELVERLTNEVYSNLEVEQECRSDANTKNSATKTEVRKEEETRQRRPNNILRDLIRILIIRELLGFPTRPGRPPFPGGPRLPMRTKTHIPTKCRFNELYG